MLQPAEADDRPDVARVHFFAGRRHELAQPSRGAAPLPPARAADGWACPDGEHELAPGEFVVAPADERHYHGAARGADAVWLAITWGATVWEDAPESA